MTDTTDRRDAAIVRAYAYFDAGTFQSELAAIASESQNADARDECRRYLSEAMGPRLSNIGFDCEIFENTDPRGGPILFAARIEDAARPTVLVYGHGDVIRAQTEAWREGLHPFHLVEEGDRLYGRGTADNKGQHFINIAALEVLAAARGALGFSVKVIIETSEETGSVGLPRFFEDRKERLAADVLIASDGPRISGRYPKTPATG